MTRAKSAVAKEDAERRIQHAKCQGQVFRCGEDGAASIWSVAVQKLPPELLKFALNTRYHIMQTWLCGEGGKACLVVASSVERDRHRSMSLTTAVRHSKYSSTTNVMMQYCQSFASSWPEIYLRDTSSWQTYRNFSHRFFPLTSQQLTSAQT